MYLKLGSIYYGNKSYIFLNSLCKQSLNISSSSPNLGCQKQPRLLKKITFILKFKPWEAGLEQGQFGEKWLRQLFLFMPNVKEHIGLYKIPKHSYSASVTNFQSSWGAA